MVETLTPKPTELPIICAETEYARLVIALLSDDNFSPIQILEFLATSNCPHLTDLDATLVHAEMRRLLRH